MKYTSLTKWIGVSALFGGALAYANPGFAANYVGDDHDDLVIGAPGEAPGASPASGVAFLFRGSDDQVIPTDIIDQAGLGVDESGDDFGSAFAMGDFDGDGEDDLAIGVPGEAPGDSPRSGAVFIYRGAGAGPSPEVVLDQSGMGANEAGDRFGTTLAAGDFNGDGIDDLVVGAPNEQLGDSPPSGVVFLFLGTPDGLLPMRYLDQGGLGANEQGDQFGAALAVGDFDGDGRADLAVGAPGEAPGDDPRSGVVFLFRGNHLGLTPHAVLDQELLGANEQGDRFGAALTTGDFDDDGRDDLAVGAPGESPGADPRSGGVFVYRGTNTGLMPRQFIDQTGLGANEAGDEFGFALSSGDYNGDGRDDLAIGAPGEAPGDAPKSGGVFIYRATETRLVSWEFLDQRDLGRNESGDRFGAALASGNYVGNSLDDLAIGAPGEAPGDDPKSGGVFLFRGSQSGLQARQFIDQAGLGANEAGDLFGLKIAD